MPSERSGASVGKASSNEAGFVKAEIAAPAGGWRTDDDVIYQPELEDSAGFENSPGESHIGFGRGRISRGVIVHHDEGIRRVRDHRLKDFSWVAERFIDAALAHRAGLNEMLLGVEKNHAQGFTIQKAHF